MSVANGGEERDIPDEQETRRLLRAARAGDFRARERLAAGHQRLIAAVARRFLISGRERDDLYQVGCIGLLKAIDRFDESLGTRFSTYAVPLIMGEIRRFLRDDSPVSVSRGLKERAARLQRRRRELTAAWGREPELWQLAEACGCSPAEALAALDAARPPLSINETRPAENHGESGLERVLAAAAPPTPDAVEEGIDLRLGLAALPWRLRLVVEQRYYRQRTQSEVAAMLGVSQVQVSRLERQALAELRRYLTA